MDIGSIFVLLALLILVALFIAQPIIKTNLNQTNNQNQEVSKLLAERERILSTLEELDFDHSLEKIPAETYQERRQELLQTGATILKQLELLQTVVQTQEARDEDRLLPFTQPDPDDPLEVLIASRRRVLHGKDTSFCPNCGATVITSDRFCPKCGKNL